MRRRRRRTYNKEQHAGHHCEQPKPIDLTDLFSPAAGYWF